MDIKSTREGFGKALVELGEKNKNVVALCADLEESMHVADFHKKFSERFVEVGVAEQNMIGVAAGLALSGKIPFAASFAVFSPGRTWDQIRVSVAYSQANVKIVGGHSGITVGADGASHQALEDIGIMRVLPNMIVIVPCDYIEAQKATFAAALHKGPVYLRLGREKVPIITDIKSKFNIGKAEIFKEGKDITIIACGIMVNEALEAAKELEKEEISAEVINCHTIKPLDKKTIVASAKKTGKVITAEEHQINCGLGSAIAELLSEEHPVPIRMIGVKDTFGESGKPEELKKKYGLSSDFLIKTAKEFKK